MVNITIKTIPEIKKDEMFSNKIEKIVKDRNKIISKRFNMDEQNIDILLFHNASNLRTHVFYTGEPLGVYSGYLNYSNEISIINPPAVKTIFSENLDKQIIIWVDYTLTKLYTCKKYFPTKEQFNIFHKHLSESLSRISSGNYNETSIKFDIRLFNENKKSRTDQELMIVFSIMLENSGLDYIYEHLDNIEKDKDIRKTIFTIYKKSINDLVIPMKNQFEADFKKSLEMKKKARNYNNTKSNFQKK